MKKMFLCSILFFLMMTGMAQATLTTIGTATYMGSEYNLIWDDDNNGNSVVWLDYTNAETTWANQVGWTASLDAALTINLYDGYAVDWEGSWRLPTTVDGPFELGYDGTTTAGYNITSSELGHLFYEELGNLGLYDVNFDYQSGCGLKNTGNFENLIAWYYYSGTEYAFARSVAWHFHLGFGAQNFNYKTENEYGLANRNGQVSVSSTRVSSTPIPGTGLLLGAGLLGLATAGRKKRRDV